MKIIKFPYSDFERFYCSNTYVIFDEDNNALVIDPSKYDGIIKYLEDNSLNLKAILLTHGHIDHMRGIKLLIKKYNVPLYMHFLDVDYLSDSNLNCSNMLDGIERKYDFKASFLNDGEKLNLLKEEMMIIHTPFHTPGSICVYFEKSKKIFTGDSLFKKGYGRTDLPGGNRKQFNDSIEKIFSLPDDVIVYPGHGENTTIGMERKYL